MHLQAYKLVKVWKLLKNVLEYLRYNIIKRLIGLPDIELATPMDNKEW